MKKISVNAYAKVNLYLNITGKRSDGYHVLDTVMMSVGLGDTITLEERKNGIKIYCSDPTIPTDARNVCYKAAKTFFESTGTGTGVTIRIKKKIPSEAGMGGGSADAAAVVMGLCRLYAVAPEKNALYAMARSVGADVPFCLEGGCQLLAGAGDEPIMKLPVPKGYMLVIKPDTGISTPEAYRNLDMMHTSFGGSSDGSWSLVSSLDSEKPDIHGKLYNIFEEVLPALAPECEKLLGELRTFTPDALLSGSGSAMFGFFRHKNERDRAYEYFSEKYPECRIFRTVPKECGLEFR